MIFSKKNPPTGYYVYIYLRKGSLTPFYVGKGKNDRAWQNNKGVKTPKDLSRIVIVAYDLTELWAFALERRIIRWYGRKDVDCTTDKDYRSRHPKGILRNLTDGGEGGTGRAPWNKGKTKETDSRLIPSEETLKKCGKHIIGTKRPEAGKKISKALKGVPKTAEHVKNFAKSIKGKIKGYFWWNNGIVCKRAKEIPGPEWAKGRLKK